MLKLLGAIAIIKPSHKSMNTMEIRVDILVREDIIAIRLLLKAGRSESLHEEKSKKYKKLFNYCTY